MRYIFLLLILISCARESKKGYFFADKKQFETEIRAMQTKAQIINKFGQPTVKFTDKNKICYIQADGKTNYIIRFKYEKVFSVCIEFDDKNNIGNIIVSDKNL